MKSLTSPITADIRSADSLGGVKPPEQMGRRRSSRRHRKGGLIVVGPLVVGLLATIIPSRSAEAAPVVASGGSIIYVQNDDVWLTSPDGVTRRQLTNDGSADTNDFTGSEPYLAPSQSDDGTLIVAARNEGREDPSVVYRPYLWVMDRQGKVLRKFSPPQWARWGSNCSDGELVVLPAGITDAVVSPDGRRIAYVTVADFYNPGNGCQPQRHSQVHVVNADGTGATLIDAGTSDPFGPSWLTNSRLLLNDAPATLYYVDLPATPATTVAATMWVREGGLFPNQRVGKLATNGYHNGTPVMRLWSSSGPPALPVGRCDYSGPAGGPDARFGDMSWAPDGKALVWDEGDGVPDEAGEGMWIMAVGDISATCPPPEDSGVFIAGAHRPYWGPAPVDLPSTLTINDVSIIEGNSGTKQMVFTITRSGGVSVSATVHWATANYTAWEPSDYVAASGSVTFGVGDTSPKQVSVTINGDTTYEVDERLVVRLSAASGATIGKGDGSGYILNDDSGPAVQTFDYTIGNTVSNGVPAPGAGNIETPGAIDAYRFTASANQRVFVDIIYSYYYDCKTWELIDPAGATVTKGWYCGNQYPSDIGHRTLPLTGTYTLKVSEPNYGTTGTYGFRIS